MCLFRKLGTGVSHQNIHIFCAQEGPKQIPQIFNIQSAMLNFLSLLGKVVLFVALFSSFPNLNQGLCGENSRTGINETKTDNSAKRTESDINIGAWLASFFSKHISAVDGDRCPSDPTCSSYSAQAFRKHGFFVGWAMTVDRLIHEGDEGSVSPLVRRNGRLKILDPVENNDFWWYSKDGQD
jgi:putative component of membrane protein insertase Oxa1/YidC/SpoIIIJ protein YidD